MADKKPKDGPTGSTDTGSSVEVKSVEVVPLEGKDRRQHLAERFYSILEKLFEEIDQEEIAREVKALQKSHPKESKEQLSRRLMKRAAARTASVGVAAGMVGGPFGLLAMAPDIFTLVREQSRLVLSIALLYGQKPGLQERFREVVAVLAVSTGTTAARRGVRMMVERGLERAVAEKIVKKTVGKYIARRLPKLVPVIGGMVGGAVNILAVAAVEKAAVEYYGSLQAEQQGEKTGSARKGKVLELNAAEEAEEKKSAARKAPARKTSAKSKQDSAEAESGPSKKSSD